MRYHAELIDRIEAHQLEVLGDLSEAARAELRATIDESLESYLEDVTDRAFRSVWHEIATYERAMDMAAGESPDDYARSLAGARGRLMDACASVLEMDPACMDALTVQAIASAESPLDRLRRLEAVISEQHVMERVSEAAKAHDGVASADPLIRGHLRAYAALARTYYQCTFYDIAWVRCSELIEADADDIAGARYTKALCAARLEDEEMLNYLDASFQRSSNAWIDLARALILYKLNRMPAATRALRTFCTRCDGAAFALLSPTYVDTYLPCRPDFETGSYDEAVLAVHEADQVVVDAPGFIPWASSVEGIEDMAIDFARRYGMDW